MLKRLMIGSAMSAIILVTLPFYSPDAQVKDQQRYFVSTRAGLVSRVRGEVFVERANTKDRERIPERFQFQMKEGDRLTTLADSRVEIMITPQTYLRLDEQAEVRAINTVIAEARFELVRGTAMVEVNRMDKGIVFELVTPQGMVAMSKEGFYRISLEPTLTRIDVIEGEIALGTRQEALGKTAVKIGDGKRVELKSDAQAAPVITPLERKPFDEFDRWSFQVAKYGVVARLEAGVYTACRDKGQNELCRVSTQFQLKDDEWLITNADSYVELRLNRGVSISDTHSLPKRGSSRPVRISPRRPPSFPGGGPLPPMSTRGGFSNLPLPPWLSRGTYLCLNGQTQLRAVKTDDDDSVFELRSGSVLISTDRYARLRPLKIITPDGTFAVGHGGIARFDVNPPQTIVSVRQGEVQMETRDGSVAKSAMDIGRGQRLRLSGGAPPRVEGFKADLKTASLDAFDRWSFHLVTAGYVTRYDGKVSIERLSGTKLELGKQGSSMQVQLWEGDRLLTAPGAHAEVLLSSKAVLHVNEESEIRAVRTVFPTPHFELLRGAAYLHHLSGLSFAYQSLWASDIVYKKTKVEISTPHGFASISEGGKYRFEIDSSGTTIKVHDGSLSLGAHQEVAAKVALKVKEKETVHLASANARRPEITKLAPSPPDDFDQWSARFLQSLDIFRRIANFSTPDTGGSRPPMGLEGPTIRF